MSQDTDLKIEMLKQLNSITQAVDNLKNFILMRLLVDDACTEEGYERLKQIINNTI